MHFCFYPRIGKEIAKDEGQDVNHVTNKQYADCKIALACLISKEDGGISTLPTKTTSLI